MAAPSANRPVTLTVLGGLQFAAFAVGCVILLGDGTLDGALSAVDIALAVGVALLGALVVGSTYSGGRVGWWLELGLAAVAVVVGAVLAAGDATFGLPLLVLGLLWLAIAALPSSRAWFLRDHLGSARPSAAT